MVREVATGGIGLTASFFEDTQLIKVGRTLLTTEEDKVPSPGRYVVMKEGVTVTKRL